MAVEKTVNTKDILHYIDAGPGSGKTHHARSEMTKDLSSVHFMVVPTHLLADQIVVELLVKEKTGGLKPVSKDRVFKIGAAVKSSPNLRGINLQDVPFSPYIDAYGEAYTDAYATEESTDDDDRLPSDEADVFSEKDKALVKSVTIHPQYRSTIAETIVDLVADRERCPLGTIVVMTHEAFLRLPPELPRRSRIRVFFDEARKFIMQVTSSVKIVGARDTAALEHFLTTHRDREFATKIKKKVKIASAGNPEFILIRLDRTEQPGQIAKALTSSNVNRGKEHIALMEILKVAQDRMMDVYVSLKDTSDKVRNIRMFEVHKVAVPSRVFCGYRSVLLMSANFTASQMFHLLNNAPQVTLVPLFSVNKELRRIMANRITILSESSSRAVIVPLTLETAKISRGRIRDDMLIPTTAKKSFIEDYKEIKASADWSESNLAKLVVKHGGTLHLVPWLLQKALAKVERLRKKNLVKGGNALVVLNKGFEYLLQGVEGVEVMSTHSHGLNKHSGKNTIIYLPAINPTPEICRLFSILIPAYQPDLDYAGEACLQAVTRTSLRDPSAKGRVYIILPDLGLTRILRTLLDPQICPEPDLRLAERLSMISVARCLGEVNLSLGRLRGGQAAGSRSRIVESAKSLALKKELATFVSFFSRIKSDPDRAHMIEPAEKELRKIKARLTKARLKANPDMVLQPNGRLMRMRPTERAHLSK